MNNQLKQFMIALIGAIMVVSAIHIVLADDNLLCIDTHTLTCPIGTTQDNITLLNVTSGNTQVLTTSQNDIGMWNVTYTFNTEGKYCARCDTTNTSTCFDIVDYCQENIDTNKTTSASVGVVLFILKWKKCLRKKKSL